MHLLVRENRTLDEQDEAEDLGLPPADLVVLSFTESDLLGLLHAQERLKAEHGAEGAPPSLQVASPYVGGSVSGNHTGAGALCGGASAGRPRLLALWRGGTGRMVPGA